MGASEHLKTHSITYYYVGTESFSHTLLGPDPSANLQTTTRGIIRVLVEDLLGSSAINSSSVLNSNLHSIPVEQKSPQHTGLHSFAANIIREERDGEGGFVGSPRDSESRRVAK